MPSTFTTYKVKNKTTNRHHSGGHFPPIADLWINRTSFLQRLVIELLALATSAIGKLTVFKYVCSLNSYGSTDDSRIQESLNNIFLYFTHLFANFLFVNRNFSMKAIIFVFARWKSVAKFMTNIFLNLADFRFAPGKPKRLLYWSRRQ